MIPRPIRNLPGENLIWKNSKASEYGVYKYSIEKMFNLKKVIIKNLRFNDFKN